MRVEENSNLWSDFPAIFPANDMTPKRFRLSSFWKAILVSGEQGGKRAKEPFVEILEPRVLFSAAPVEVGEVSEEATVQEARPTPSAEVLAESGDAESGDAAAGAAIPELELLSLEVVETLAAEARQRWIDSGISAEQVSALDAIRYDIADVGGAHLGVAKGFSIMIDDDAGGAGADHWFIDPTPSKDEEFGEQGGAAGSGKFDLLSTLMHEQGHVLGLGDVSGDRADVMDGVLDLGTRRLPVAGQAEGAAPGSLTGAHFLTADLSRVSHTDNGEEATGGGSFHPSFSPDGLTLVFESDASNLVSLGSGDTNGQRDIFINYLPAGYVERVNTNAADEQSSGGASRPFISSQGRHVVFDSAASDLVTGDTNGSGDVFVKNRQTREVIRANTNAAGEESMGGSAMAAGISADGRYVLFGSDASDLVDNDTNGEADLFLKDLQTGAISRVNTDAAGEQSSGHALATITGSFSADGRYVVFASGASNLVAGDTNGNVDIFRKDLQTGAIVRVDTDSAGNETASRPGGDSSRDPVVSSDGRYVVFRSSAPDLVPGDTNGLDDLFVKDLLTGAISRMNTDAGGAQATGGDSGDASISNDGRYVVFSSLADNLVADDTNGTVDTFVKDLRTGKVERLTTNAAGEQGMGAAGFGGSTFVRGTTGFFASDATNLVADDTNGNFDLFRADFSPLITAFSTSVTVDGNGDLLISGSGSIANDLFLEVKNGRLEISDSNAMIGGPIVGSVAVGNEGRKISVDLAAFTRDIIVRMQGGDDRVTIGNLAGIAGGIEVEDGSGHDVVRQTGEIAVQGAGSVSFAGEEIRLESGSRIAVEDGGVDLLANQGNTSAVNSVGLRMANSEITTTGTGNVNLRGNGGKVGSGNIGIVIDETRISTGGGRLILSGNGGEGVHRNEGVHLGRGTGITVAGTGDFDIYGYGYGSGNRNQGVVIDRDVELRSADGRLLIRGWGAEGGAANVGLSMDRATLVNTGGFGTILRGEANGTGSRNTGIVVNGTTIRDESGGELSLTGLGSDTSQGVGNRAMELNSATISATGGGFVRMVGNGGSGTHRNDAVRITNSNIGAESNSVQVTGNVSDDASRNGNRGVFISGSTITAGTDLTATGRAGGGVNGNEAMRLLSSKFMAGGEVELRGERSAISASVLTSGAFNRGLFARSLEVSGSVVSVTGQGNAGTNGNEGLRLIGGTFTSSAGAVGFGGTASEFTTGRGNLGAFVRGISIDANGSASINGQGGRGTSGNFGLYLDGATVVSRTSTAGFTGSGRDQSSGSRNYGAMVVNSDFTATTSFSAIGRGGGTVNGNSGMTIRGGSITAGTTLSLFGSGRSWATGRGNFGVNLQGVEISTEGDVSINSIGGGGTHGNFATQLRRVDIASATGRVDVAGQGIDDPIGNGNFGMRIIASTIEGADILVDGDASSGANGNFGTLVAGGSMNSTNGFVVVMGSGNGLSAGFGNFGALVRNATLSAIGDGMNVIGGGGGGISNNFGARVDGGLLSSDIGGAILRGSAGSGTTGVGNYGLRVSGANVSAGTNIEFQGTGGGGRNNNHGVQLVRVSGDAGNRLEVAGTAISTTTGNNNQGALLIRNRLSSEGEATLTGTGGGGVSGNAALRVIGGSFGSTLNRLVIAGEADANTGGRGNGGVFLLSRTNLTGTSIEIDGTGGGGVGANFGTFIVRSVSAPGAVVTGTTTDGVSDDEAGGFVP